jgi:hypothetical protein
MFVEQLVTDGKRNVVVNRFFVTLDFCFLISTVCEFYILLRDILGQAVKQLGESLRFNPDCRGLDYVLGIFH